MTNLKTNLDEYLLQNDSRRGFRWGIPDGWRPGWATPSSESAPTEVEDAPWYKKINCDCLPALTRTQRLIGFATCMLLGILCFTISLIFIPVLLLKMRKFALLYTFGSCFIVLSFSFLHGPWNHLKQLFSKEKILATVLYGSTLIATLFSACYLNSTVLTVIFAVMQIVVLVWITLGFVPGGAAGVRTFGNMFRTTVSHTLPV